jgi:glutamate 5-kinase
MKRNDLTNAKRIVIKLGTNILRNDDGNVSLPRIFSFIEDISRLVREGKEVIVVTSGAVGLGKKRLGLDSTEGTAVKQACAAIGQGALMSIYESGFDTYGLVCAQVLLTEEDFTVRERYSNLRTTMSKLLEFGVVPVINQNDTVSVQELVQIYENKPGSFSDNDKLSALVAKGLDADLLLILSDVDGLFDANPKTNPDAKKIEVVEEVTDEICALGTDASEGGRGGMRTKLDAARLVTNAGAQMIIANGQEPFVIKRIFAGEKLGTLFLG